ncbi:MAG: TonB-dependent receptor [Phycisphaerales bacterium]|nr:TonB-dependent receptor [Phycisphaerales bacterium]
MCSSTHPPSAGLSFAAAALLAVGGTAAVADEPPDQEQLPAVVQESSIENSVELDDDLLDDSLDSDASFDNDFADLDIEALMSIEVTSVAGVKQSLLRTPAAMYVITAEDIRRSGHRNVAEALRIVPGMAVASVSANQWAISARGFNSLFATNMLVLVDGRVVYDPIWSGVPWELQDLLLEDIDRIEVVRGPGATLWGANAVNGVINITSKSAHDTHGAYISGGVGTEERAFGKFRYGGALDDDASYRIWGKYHLCDTSVDAAGDSRHDDWDFYRGGFRLDFGDVTDAAFTIQADAYHTDTVGESRRVAIPGHMTFQTIVDDAWFSGGHVLARMTREYADDGGWSLQAYYDRLNARRYGPLMNRDTADIDFRHHFVPLDTHEIVWGLGARYSRARIDPSPTLTFRDLDRETWLLSGFVQDTIALMPDRLSLMVGSKFLHNDFTGFEIQPSARLSWTPDDRQTLWGAVSRAVRTPARINDDMVLTGAFVDVGLMGGGPPAGIFAPVQLVGDDGTDAEELIACELGYRAHVSDEITIDIAAFYNIYDNIIEMPPTGGTADNTASAESFGVEIASTWQAAPNWRVTGAYSLVEILAHTRFGDENFEDGDPHHQLNIRSMLDITDDLELNVAGYYVDGVSRYDVPAYFRLDVGLTWHLNENMELSVWGQNLLDPAHREYGDDIVQDMRAEVQRGVYAQLTWRF